MIKTCKVCGKQADMMSWEDTCCDCLRKKELERIRGEIEEAKKSGDEVDTFSSDYVICPYCGAEIEARMYGVFDFPEAYEEGVHVLKCEECGKEYRLHSDVSYSWETRKIEGKSKE